MGAAPDSIKRASENPIASFNFFFKIPPKIGRLRPYFNIAFPDMAALRFENTFSYIRGTPTKKCGFTSFA